MNTIVSDTSAREALRIVRDEAVRALQIVRDHTDADNPVSYRSDDREGCLDAVFSEAQRALGYIAKVEVASLPSLSGEWQPIETAPKDGAVVDLWGEDLGRMTDCYWGRPSHECGEMGEYCDSDWHFDTRESWVDGTFNERLSNTFITHWTLPPQPPALSSGKAALKSPDHILDPVEGKGEHPAS